MAKGRLILRGFFGSSQIYPQGNSDADTLNVTVATASFVGADGKEKSVYSDLADARYTVRGAGGSTVYSRILRGGGVRVRLQGIDAPELHYEPQGSKTFFRQPRGAYTSRRLNEGLRFYAGDEQPCELVTSVEKPGDAFDVYGRLIADVLVGAGPEKRDLNLQLLREGLALPTFYNSMDTDEITAAIEATAIGKLAQDSIWKQYTGELSFDQSLLAPKLHEAVDDKQPDLGPVILPKLFRRFSTHIMGGGTPGGFKESLATSAEKVLLTADVLAGSAAATPKLFADFIDATDPSKPTFTAAPGDIVFLETGGQLYLERPVGTFVPWT